MPRMTCIGFPNIAEFRDKDTSKNFENARERKRVE